MVSKAVSEQNLKTKGTVFYFYESVIPPLTDDQVCLLYEERPLQPDAFRKVQTIVLPQLTSTPDSSDLQPYLFYYPFGYTFVQLSFKFSLSGSSKAEKQSLFALVKEMKDKNDLHANTLFSWLSSKLSLPFTKEQPHSNYIIITLDQFDGDGVESNQQMLGFFQKTVCSISVKKNKNNLSCREHEPIRITIKTRDIISLESYHGIIVTKPKNINSYLSTILFSLALDQRLEAIENELEKQRREALPFARYTGKATYKSLTMYEKFREGSTKIHSQALEFVELSKCISSPNSVVPESQEFNNKIHSAFKETYQFENRKDVVDNYIETLQDLFDICCDRVSEFKYFFYEAILEIIIVVILVAELVAIIFEK